MFILSDFKRKCFHVLFLTSICVNLTNRMWFSVICTHTLQFEFLIDKVDSEQKDFYLLGDLNCNMNDGSNHNSSTLTNILDIYGLSQLISEPTRITPTSSTLIDLCITSSPEKISKAGVVHLGISNHSLVFMTLKISYERTGSHRTM